MAAGGNGYANIALATTTDLATFTKQGMVLEVRDRLHNPGAGEHHLARVDAWSVVDGLLRFYYHAHGTKTA